jgi:hypothetical protein
MKPLIVIFILVLVTPIPAQASDVPTPTRESKIAPPAPRPIYSPYAMIRYEAVAASPAPQRTPEILPAAPARVTNRPPLRPNKPRPSYLP